MAETYAGLDVSDKMTHVCVTDGARAVLWAGACATDPAVIDRTLKVRAPGLVRYWRRHRCRPSCFTVWTSVGFR